MKMHQDVVYFNVFCRIGLESHTVYWAGLTQSVMTLAWHSVFSTLNGLLMFCRVICSVEPVYMAVLLVVVSS